MKLGVIAAAVALTLPVSVMAQNQGSGRPEIINHRINKVDGGAPTAGGTASLTPISNHGGPVMSAVNVYLIWYGNWNQTNGSDTAAGQAIVRNLLANIGGSAHYMINSSYPGVTGNVTLSSNEYVDTGSQGKRLRDSAIKTIVTNAINSPSIPSDPGALYFVLTSSDVTETSGFCTKYCGWHTHASIGGADIKYSFVGNANRCLSSCAPQTVGPNGNAGVDGMASVIVHELEETNTDPDLNAWYDASGAENADKCAWTFGGAQQVDGNGAYYNNTLGGHNYEIQRNLKTDNKCYVAGTQQ